MGKKIEMNFNVRFTLVMCLSLASIMASGQSTSSSTTPASKKHVATKAVVLRPEEQEAQKHYRIALEALKHDDYPTAADELTTASKLTPKNALIWYNLAIVESKKGDSASALQHLQKAQSLGLPKSVQDDAEQLDAKLSYEAKHTAGSSLSGTSTVSQHQASAEVSYDDTVHYIQERLYAGLQESARCEFVFEAGPQYFNASQLSPHVSWSSNGEAVIPCSGGKDCVRHSGEMHSEVELSTRDDTNKAKLEKALLHLLDLCGVRPARDDLF